MIIKKILRLTLSCLLAILFIWLIARQINPDELKSAFVHTNAYWIFIALIAFFLGYVCRINRWCLMLRCDNPSLRGSDCAGPLLASFAANNILPFRAGDLLRTFAFNKRLGVSAGIVIATLFVERLLDLLMVLLLLGVALAVFGLDLNKFAGIGSVALVVIAIGILLVLLLPQLFSPLAMFVGKLIARLAPRFGQKLAQEIDKSLKTLAHLSKGSTMIRLVLWSIVAWAAEGCVFWFSAIALSSITLPSAGWLALPVGTLATLIPSTPGYVGTFDYFTIRAMSALGNNLIPATAYALLVHILLWLPPTLIGGVYLLLHPTKKQNKPKSL